MDVMLIVPPWLTREGNIWNGVKGTWPPLGLLYVAAYAEARGHRVRVLDAIAERSSLEDIAEAVRAARPAFVGLTSVTAQIPGAHRVAEIVKRVAPAARVIIGGVHATALPDDLLADRHVDYVIRGEGERPFADLVDGVRPERIAGLSYRSAGEAGEVCHNPLDAPIAELDALPAPAYHLIRFDLYRPAVGAYRRLPAMAMMATRGCPGHCVFCSSARTTCRTRSAEHILAEMMQLQERYGVREISFYDDTFTVFKRNVARLCDLMIARRLDLTWSCFARTDCVNPDLLAKMHRAGCHQILYGIESADADILRNIRKPIDLERSRAAVRMTRRAGIEVRAAFMLGNIGETAASMRRTIDFARSLDPDIAVFNITVPFPGTEMYEWARAHGYLRVRDWQDYDIANAVVELPTVSSDEVNRMYRRAYREFYLRPGYVLRRLLRIRGWEDVRMNLRAARAVLAARATEPGDSRVGSTREGTSLTGQTVPA